MNFPLSEAEIQYRRADGTITQIKSVLPVVADAMFQLLIGPNLESIEPTLLLDFLGPATSFAITRDMYINMELPAQQKQLKNIRDRLISLRACITYKLTEDHSDIFIAFTPHSSVDLQATPTLCWTTMLPTRLQHASTVAEVYHVLCLAAAAAIHEISHILPRFLRGPFRLTPPTVHACGTNSRVKGGEAGEVSEEGCFGGLMEIENIVMDPDQTIIQRCALTFARGKSMILKDTHVQAFVDATIFSRTSSLSSPFFDPGHVVRRYSPAFRAMMAAAVAFPLPTDQRLFTIIATSPPCEITPEFPEDNLGFRGNPFDAAVTTSPPVEATVGLGFIGAAKSWLATLPTILDSTPHDSTPHDSTPHDGKYQGPGLKPDAKELLRAWDYDEPVEDVVVDMAKEIAAGIRY